MQYFKHLTSGRKGDRLKPLYAEFGKAKGYGLFFMLLEMCAEKYNGKNELFIFRKNELLAELEIRSRNLVAMLQLLISYEVITDLLIDNKTGLIQFRWPQLIEIADEYTKKVRQRSNKNPENVDPYNKNKNKNNSLERESSLANSKTKSLPNNRATFSPSSPDEILSNMPVLNMDLWSSLYPQEFLNREAMLCIAYWLAADPGKKPQTRGAWAQKLGSWFENAWQKEKQKIPKTANFGIRNDL